MENTFSSKISANIWGHRFTDGQRGPEYTLEFLNVMAGTGFRLDRKFYNRRKMLSFRQFVYEGDKEGAEGHISSFSDENKERIMSNLGIGEKQLADIQHFFKNLTIPLMTATGKSTDRSWYAKMMYPLHESLLFYEVRANRDKKRQQVSFNFEKNFFARGGELYYLMLFYGTANNLELRSSLESNLKRLLVNDSGITRIVNSINNLFEEGEHEEGYATLVRDPEDSELHEVFKDWNRREYPVLPVNDAFIYTEFAEELNALISLPIDVYEMFDLLTSLITFQLHRYMLNRAEEVTNREHLYFIDCLEGQNTSIKVLAQESYRLDEELISDAFKVFVNDKVEKLLPSDEEAAISKIETWRADDTSVFLKIAGLDKVRAPKKKKIIEALQNGKPREAVKLLKFRLTDSYMEELGKVQIPVMRNLSRDGQFAIFRQGMKPRYILNEKLLSVLVYATLSGKDSLPFEEFISALYHKYKIVIGEKAAKESGLYEREGINLAHFRNNEKKMRQKLKQNGLLQEYSDATALVRNPYQ